MLLQSWLHVPRPLGCFLLRIASHLTFKAVLSEVTVRVSATSRGYKQLCVAEHSSTLQQNAYALHPHSILMCVRACSAQLPSCLWVVVGLGERESLLGWVSGGGVGARQLKLLHCGSEHPYPPSNSNGGEREGEGERVFLQKLQLRPTSVLRSGLVMAGLQRGQVLRVARTFLQVRKLMVESRGST